MKRHAAKIKIDGRLLLSMLDFEGAAIRNIKLDDGRWPLNEIVMVLEHPDLPEVLDGDHLQEICPEYSSTCAGGVVTEVKRTHPEKKEA